MRRARCAWLGLGALLATGLAGELYARLPASIEVEPLDFHAATRDVTLLFHGRGGRDEPGLVALERRLHELIGTQPGSVVRRYIWAPHSDVRLRAAENGERIGHELGRELARLPALEAVHLVAHSAGAYVLDPLCRALRAGTQRRVRVTMTFLDPMGIRGTVDTGWGQRHYGACADYAEAWINTDDRVPASNDPLAHAYNIDVTAASGRAAYGGDGHRWPMYSYLAELDAERLRAQWSHETRPRGAVERR